MSATDPFPAETTPAAGGAAALPWGSRARGTVGQVVGAREFAILVFLLAISLAIGIARPTFFTTSNLLAGGSDLAPAQVDGLREGYVAFGLGQNPYLQGFYPVMIMHQAIEYGIRPITIDTGTDVVTPENVEEYNPEFR